MRWIMAAAALAIAGAGSIVVGIAVGRPEVSAEGASFTRATGTPAFSSVLHQTGTGLFTPADGNLWIGVGLACCLGAVVLVVFGLRVRRTAAAD
jgi:hypothetical protein